MASSISNNEKAKNGWNEVQSKRQIGFFKQQAKDERDEIERVKRGFDSITELRVEKQRATDDYYVRWSEKSVREDAYDHDRHRDEDEPDPTDDNWFKSKSEHRSNGGSKRVKRSLTDYEIMKAMEHFSDSKISQIIANATAQGNGFSGPWWNTYSMSTSLCSHYRTAFKEWANRGDFVHKVEYYSFKATNRGGPGPEIKIRLPWLFVTPKFEFIVQLSQAVTDACYLLEVETVLWLQIQLKAACAFAWSRVPGIYLIIRDIRMILFNNYYNALITHKVTTEYLRCLMSIEKTVDNIWNQQISAAEVTSYYIQHAAALKLGDPQEKATSLFDLLFKIRYGSDSEVGFVILIYNAVLEVPMFSNMSAFAFKRCIWQWHGVWKTDVSKMLLPTQAYTPIDPTDTDTLNKKLDGIAYLLNRAWETYDPKQGPVVTRSDVKSPASLVCHNCINSEGAKANFSGSRRNNKNYYGHLNRLADDMALLLKWFEKWDLSYVSVNLISPIGCKEAYVPDNNSAPIVLVENNNNIQRDFSTINLDEDTGIQPESISSRVKTFTKVNAIVKPGPPATAKDKLPIKSTQSWKSCMKIVD